MNTTSATNTILLHSKEELSKKYQKKTDKEHILDKPDTYIGSIEYIDNENWVFDDATQKIVSRPIKYIPGLYKLFDEIIVNCRDHIIRVIRSTIEDKKFVTAIDVTIQEDGTIIMENDGDGIDVVKHPEYDVWIPEMIFAHLRSSTNYDKDEKLIGAGKNGLGSKLVFIWSEYGSIETVDHRRGLRYFQEYRNNLDVIEPPKITKVKTTTKPITKITFRPDYKRFGIPEGLTPDIISLLKRRVYDIGAVSDHSIKKVKVSYNGAVIPVKNFKQYIDLYLSSSVDSKTNSKVVYESAGERWEYAVAMSPTHEFTQISFVNGISTFKGGKHVEYIIGQIVRKICEYIEKKKKVKVNSTSIKEQLIIFLRCDIENPSFDSQTKDYMNTPSNKFGSTCAVTEEFVEKVAKMGIMDIACRITEAKENRNAKKTDGTKTKNIRGIANFIDANFAGTAQSKDCILILCEGLSALSGVVSGLSSNDRNIIGIYPLKGKLLNVRGEAIAKISANKEITDMKKILGLENEKVYTSIEDVNRCLRYGKIMILTDSDVDGSHIKGLCINAFDTLWASLVRIPGFISFMNTPILRASRKGQSTISFYHEGEYQQWKETLNESQIQNWHIKYYKGLGTSTSVEFKEYFANKKVVDFTHSGQVSTDAIDKVFNKKRPDDRKTWLEDYDKTTYLDTNNRQATYEAFIDKELRHFSKYDCERSIPNMVDGLKTSLRKILYCALKRKLTTEIKVAQFSGYVSEHSNYHHGEASLNGAIVGMAQDFIGSNNINLLEPNGQFGTRNLGGDDAASERYIFTQLNPLVRYIFPEADDSILTYINDDGTIVEPEYYVPIIPFCLVNGIKGIGTGFSCSVEPYHPKDLMEYIKNKLDGHPEYNTRDFVPYYEGFKGTLHKLEEKKFLIKGRYEKIADDKIRITELPVGTWTMPYITFLEELLDGKTDKEGKKTAPILKDMTNLSTEKVVDIQIQFPNKTVMGEWEKTLDSSGLINGIEKTLKLTTTVSTTNIHMFQQDMKLKKYNSVPDIIDEYYDIRMDVYGTRKTNQIVELEKRLVKLSNKAKYILLTLDGVIDLRKKTNAQISEMLREHGIVEIEGNYNYVIKLPMDSVSEENVKKILKEKEETAEVLETLRNTPLTKIWRQELDELEVKYDLYKKSRQEKQSGLVSGSGSEKKKILKRK
jgi:DNA topoisomerase-2